MEEFKYCPMCAGPLEKKEADGRERMVCVKCGHIAYRNPLPATACLVAGENGGLLLIKRGVEPHKGEWSLPGGFIELDEDLSRAAERELEEETGLSGKAGRVVGARIQESGMYGAVLVVGVEVVASGGELSASDDAEEAKFFPLDGMPDIPFESHRELIQQFLS